MIIPKIQITPNFSAHELLDPWTIVYWGIRRSLKFIPDVVPDCQYLRSKTGPIEINNWHHYSMDPLEFIRQPKSVINIFRKFSGYRPQQWVIDSLVNKYGATPVKVAGAISSAHRHSKAMDPRSHTHSPAELLEVHRKNPKLVSTRVEPLSFTPTWFHIDSFYTGVAGLVTIKMI